MTGAEFAARAAAVLEPCLLSLGGRVLYSEPESLTQGCPAGVYYLGINAREAPSSSHPDHHSVRTIARDLELFGEGQARNALLDEAWKGRAAGTAEL